MAQQAVQQGTTPLGSKQFEAALAVFEQAVALDPQNVDAWAGKGITFLGLGRVQETVGAAAQAQVALHQQ